MKLKLFQFHEDERLLAWIRTIRGRVALWIAAMALLLWHHSSLFLLAAVTAVLLSPGRRRLFLSIAALGVIVDRFVVLRGLPTTGELLWQWPSAQYLSVAGSGFLLAAIGAGCLCAVYIVAQRVQHWPAVARRHPALSVHAGIWLALLLSSLPGLGLLRTLDFFAWRLSYLAVSATRGKVTETVFTDHLFYLLPVYGGNATPYGKGLDFLSRHEAFDAESLARSQLGGVKLLLLSILWTYAYVLLDTVVFGRTITTPATWPVTLLSEWSLSWPGLGESLLSGARPTWYLGWLTIYVELIRSTLALAATGHLIIGCLRIFGFDVFRNTYKPLLAQSILDFWNRYFYYFKELLVDFFFYPTYIRLRKLSPAPRLFAAIFAAAFLGNMYVHLLADPDLMINFDSARLWSHWSPRLVYCLLLAAGIWVSMLRQPRLRASGETATFWLKIRRIAGVWTFFSIIHIWNVRLEGVGIGDCSAFFLSLFGI